MNTQSINRILKLVVIMALMVSWLPTASAALNTGTWSALAHNRLDSSGLALAVIGSNLYVGGDFTHSADGTVTNLNGIAKWGPSAVPGIPILLTPPNGTLTTTQAITLAWQAGAGETSLGYNVQVDGSLITTTATTSATLLSNGIHNWTVRAYNATGYSAWVSPTWTITVHGYRVFLPLVQKNISSVAGMVPIPAGNFQMGCDPSHNGGYSYCDGDNPLHPVYLDAYQIDQNLVTNAQYAQCVTASHCTAPGDTSSNNRTSYYGNSTYNNYPVIHMTWSQASTYCAWAGKRLPSEAEWEKAARGSSDTRAYPWGNQAPNSTLANFNHNVDDTSAVGSYPAGVSPYGALDMAGNVWEWVNDWYDGSYYNTGPASNPPGPATGTLKVLRGGSWDDDTASSLRVAYRNNDHPTPLYSGDSDGFRCVVSSGSTPSLITLTLQAPQVNGLAVTMTGTVTTNLGMITRLNWQWGDGASGDHWFPASHTYALSGTYSITATAYNSPGATKIVTATVFVTRPPTSEIILRAPQVDGLAVTISGTVTTLVGTLTRLNWQWGDGAGDDQLFPATHTYALSGTYQITATAYNSLGTTKVATTTAYVGVNTTGMVLIPAGNFQMGCDANHSGGYGCNGDDLLHPVYLDAYRIDQNLVTNAQYIQCVAAGSCTAPYTTTSEIRSSYYGNSNFSNYPVIHVIWSQAGAYCAWAGKRLPSEAEWEKAARGSSDTRAYPWGDAAPTCELANWGNCVGGDTSEVGSNPSGASPYGVLDMAGNVFEWVNDWYNYSYYNSSPASNPPGPITGTTRGIRGGFWGYHDYYLRVANREDYNPAYQADDIGFRCAVPAGN